MSEMVGERVTQEKPNIEVVIPIDPTRKYILVFDRHITQHEGELIRKDIENWLKSEHPFLVIGGGIKLERVYAIEGSK